MTNEYMVEVINNNEHTFLKSYGSTVENIVDNMVDLIGVSKIISIINIKTKEEWELHEDINFLRHLKNQIPDNIEMFFEVREDNDTTH